MTHAAALPAIIQGGMGVGVSDWRLARAVSSLGHLGVVSGTGLDTLFVRRLQDGDPGGHLRRAMEHVPLPDAADEALARYFRPGGRRDGEPYELLPMYRQVMDAARHRLTALANFVEVFLAREGHGGLVGTNLLTKIQAPNLASLYGAMLAGVDVVLMGAGIPREIPGVLDGLAVHEPVSVPFDVAGTAPGDPARLSFDPSTLWTERPPPLKRPRFLAVVASDSLAAFMVKRATGRVDGFVVEGPTAGGHNAPPRGRKRLDDRGEPVYGERDEVDLARVAGLGLPFWVAGGAGRPGRVREVQAAGGRGIQVGTLFAFCRESGLAEGLKRRVLEAVARGRGLEVRTEDRASPTGFPFKTVQLPETLASESVYRNRRRRCDLGYLRTPYWRDDGRIGYRCPAEPVETFVKKGGRVEETAGRKCLCNALMANVGRGQVRSRTPGGEGGDAAVQVEPPLLTSGDQLTAMEPFLRGRTSYSAADVIEYLRPDPSPGQ